MAVVVPQWTSLASFIIELFECWLLTFWLNSELDRDSIRLPPVLLSFHVVLCGLDLQGKCPGANVERHGEGPVSDHGLQGIPHRHYRAFCGQDDRREAAGGGGCQPPQGLQASEPPHLQLYGNGCINVTLQRQRMNQVFWMLAIKSWHISEKLNLSFFLHLGSVWPCGQLEEVRVRPGYSQGLFRVENEVLCAEKGLVDRHARGRER